jgi:hypothetical protein
MNLNNLKPAWRRFQVVNALSPLNQHDILLMLENAEEHATTKTNRLLMHSALFLVLTFCFHGG